MSTPSVAVVGTGVIGAAWATLFLSRGYVVRAHDPGPDACDRLAGMVSGSWPALVALGADEAVPLDRLVWCDDLADAVADVEFVQESGPEVRELKQQLVSTIDALTARGVVIASSSSGLRPTDIQATCSHDPGRVLVGHPFHPAHLIPLVEVVGGSATADAAMDRAIEFYTAVGKRPIRVRHELAGHVVNRLQAALWREAYSLVDSGVVTVAEVDAAITDGPGLRWSVVGPFAGQHLSGGPGGIEHTLEHLGPPMVAWWGELGQADWTPDLVRRVVDQTADEMDGRTSAELSKARDRVVLQILAAKAAEPHLRAPGRSPS